MKKGDRIRGVNQAGVTVEGEIMWVVGEEFSIRNLDSLGYSIYRQGDLANLEVTFESAPSFQSSVAEMSDDALRKSIEELRQKRATLPRPSRGQGQRRTKEDPIMKLIASLSKEETTKLMEKMGMI